MFNVSINSKQKILVAEDLSGGNEVSIDKPGKGPRLGSTTMFFPCSLPP